MVLSLFSRAKIFLPSRRAAILGLQYASQPGWNIRTRRAWLDLATAGMCVGRCLRPERGGRAPHGEAGSVGLGCGSVQRASAGRKVKSKVMSGSQAIKVLSWQTHVSVFCSVFSLVGFHCTDITYSVCLSPADGHFHGLPYLPIRNDAASICERVFWWMCIFIQ